MANNIYFHAIALTGKLNKPFEEQRKRKPKRPQENYLSQHAKTFRLKNIIPYSAAHKQVSGHTSKRNRKAFVMLATSFVENLNVLDVLTADRVVAQISTTYFTNETFPQATLLAATWQFRLVSHGSRTSSVGRSGNDRCHRVR